MIQIQLLFGLFVYLIAINAMELGKLSDMKSVYGYNINFNFDNHNDQPNILKQNNNKDEQAQDQEQNKCDYEGVIKYYANANYAGQTHETKLTRNSCHSVLEDFKATEGVSSFELNEHCILAFKTADCSGPKLYIIPGHCDNHATAECWNDQIKSLKLC